MRLFLLSSNYRFSSFLLLSKDWKFDFTPNDVSDLTAKVAAGKVNPKIVLTIRFGKGAIGAAKDIVVENISFTGTIRIRIS